MITWEGLAEMAEVFDARMTHRQLVAEVLALCERLPVEVFYWPDSTRVSRRGWPDLSIGGPGGWIFREVKPAFARPSSRQRMVGYLMTAAALDWAVWQPADLAAGRIRAQLRAIAGYAAVS